MCFAAVGRQCYQCGYQVVDNGTPMPLPGLPECFEDATLQSHKVECEGGDECCGSVREWIDMYVPLSNILPSSVIAENFINPKGEFISTATYLCFPARQRRRTPRC